MPSTFIPTPRAMEVVLAFAVHNTVAPEIATVRFHTQKADLVDPTPVPTTVLADCADKYELQFKNTFLTHLTNQMDLVRVACRDISQAGGEVITHTFTDVGGVAATPLPMNVAACITWRTARSGRAYRGRTYLPGIPETYRSTVNPVRNLIAANAAQYAADATTFLANLSAQSRAPHVLSKQIDGAARSTGVLTPITTATCNVRLDSQRRRLGR